MSDGTAPCCAQAFVFLRLLRFELLLVTLKTRKAATMTELSNPMLPDDLRRSMVARLVTSPRRGMFQGIP